MRAGKFSRGGHRYDIRMLLSITRRDRSRAISLFANVAPGKSQAEAFRELPAA
ncbi:MAG: hypothetical protein HY554_13190 [Elusimicrobia bacterium]|nr:hypothetical protein [Elusimicrobiota bacterium]